MTKIRLRLNRALNGLPEGSVVALDADANGVPLDRYWRNRLKDSAIDGCVSVVGDEPADEPGATEDATDGPEPDPAPQTPTKSKGAK